MAFSLTNPISALTSYTNTYTGPTNVMTGALSLTAFADIPTGVLSGGAGTFYSNLVYSVAGTALSTLSASPTSIYLEISGYNGNIDNYGYVDPVNSNTWTQLNSGGTFNVLFTNPDFLNTVISLSANKTSVIVLGTSIIDSPLTSGSPAVNLVYNGLSANNDYILTNYSHARLVAYMG